MTAEQIEQWRIRTAEHLPLIPHNQFLLAEIALQLAHLVEATRAQAQLIYARDADYIDSRGLPGWLTNLDTPAAESAPVRRDPPAAGAAAEDDYERARR